MTDVIRAELSGSDTCTAEGITVRANAPVLGLCRKLVDAGHGPATPLHAYRGDVLCLKIKSIGEGAKLAVREDNRKGLRLVRWMPFPGAGGGSGIDEEDWGLSEAAEWRANAPATATQPRAPATNLISMPRARRMFVDDRVVSAYKPTRPHGATAARPQTVKPPTS